MIPRLTAWAATASGNTRESGAVVETKSAIALIPARGAITLGVDQFGGALLLRAADRCIRVAQDVGGVALLKALCNKHGDAVIPLVIDLLDPTDCASLAAGSWWRRGSSTGKPKFNVSWRPRTGARLPSPVFRTQVGDAYSPSSTVTIPLCGRRTAINVCFVSAAGAE